MCAPKLAVAGWKRRAIRGLGVQKSRIPTCSPELAPLRLPPAEPANGGQAEIREEQRTERIVATVDGNRLLSPRDRRRPTGRPPRAHRRCEAEPAGHLLHFRERRGRNEGPRCARCGGKTRRHRPIAARRLRRRPAPVPNSFSRLPTKAATSACSSRATAGAISSAITRSWSLPTRSRAIIGGANVETTYLTDDGREALARSLAPDRRARRPGPRAAISIRSSCGRRRRARSCARCDGSSSATARSEGLLQWKFSGPLSRKNRLAGGARPRACRRQRRLDLIAAYFSPPWSFMRRLGRIARRGQARVITAAKSDNNATIAAARHTYTRLLRRGVQMFEYQPAKLHTKLGDRRRRRPHRLGEPRFPKPVHQHGDRAAGRRRRLRQRDARLFRARACIAASRSRPRCTDSARPCGAGCKWTISYWLVTSLDYTVTRRLNFIER